MEFSERPFIVIWEVTQACDLVCAHCRACAQPKRDAGELSSEEGRRLIDEIAELQVPVFVLTGGDPLKRPDTVELVEHGARLGLRMGMTPSGTPLMTPEVLRRLRDAGLSRLAVSLDGSTAAVHDAFRGVEGSYDWTLRMLREARALGLSTQINTTVSRHNLDDFEGLATLMEGLGISLWSVFFLVPTGRGSALGGLRPEQCERLFSVLHRVQRTRDFIVKVTEAPHYRRHVAQQMRPTAGGAGHPHGHVEMPTLLTTSEGPGHTVGLAPRGVNAGNGFLFVSHRGDVFPSGFLPVKVGSVREASLSSIYRDAPLLRALRDPDALEGRCGRCEFRAICGGSRSRAYALSGNPFATDPWCTYQPASATA